MHFQYIKFCLVVMATILLTSAAYNLYINEKGGYCTDGQRYDDYNNTNTNNASTLQFPFLTYLDDTASTTTTVTTAPDGSAVVATQSNAPYTAEPPSRDANEALAVGVYENQSASSNSPVVVTTTTTVQQSSSQVEANDLSRGQNQSPDSRQGTRKQQSKSEDNNDGQQSKMERR